MRLSGGLCGGRPGGGHQRDASPSCRAVARPERTSCWPAVRSLSTATSGGHLLQPCKLSDRFSSASPSSSYEPSSEVDGMDVEAGDDDDDGMLAMEATVIATPNRPALDDSRSPNPLTSSSSSARTSHLSAAVPMVATTSATRGASTAGASATTAKRAQAAAPSARSSGVACVSLRRSTTREVCC